LTVVVSCRVVLCRVCLALGQFHHCLSVLPLLPLLRDLAILSSLFLAIVIILVLLTETSKMVVVAFSFESNDNCCFLFFKLNTLHIYDWLYTLGHTAHGAHLIPTRSGKLPPPVTSQING
jgi:hypothetical protein